MRPAALSPWLVVTVIVAGCSFKDFSALQEGQAGTSGAAGSASEGLGGNSGKGGTSGRGGTSTTGGASATGGTGTTAATIVPNPPVPYGPWTFDTAADVPADWARILKNTSVGWVAEGEAAPLGAMIIDTTAGTTGGESRHDFVSMMDLRGHTMTARVRLAAGETSAQLYANSNNPTFAYGIGETLMVGTEWTTLALSFDAPATTSGVYTPQYVTRVAVQIGGPGVLWVDSVTITPALTDADIATTAGTGGSTGTGGATGT